MVSASSKMFLIATIVITSTTQVTSAILQQNPKYPFKRVPQGFLGMRGKKDVDYQQSPGRRMQGFIGVKGKKFDDDAQSDRFYYKHTPIDLLNLMQRKDAGTLYGKIDYTAADRGDDIFLPYWDNNIDAKDLPTQSIPYENKERDVEFWNSYNDYLSKSLSKRADRMSSFYGMRGKKIPRSIVYRGKKIPFDFSFRGKFVGVRGKKSESESWNDGMDNASAAIFPNFNGYTEEEDGSRM